MIQPQVWKKKKKNQTQFLIIWRAFQLLFVAIRFAVGSLIFERMSVQRVAGPHFGVCHQRHLGADNPVRHMHKIGNKLVQQAIWIQTILSQFNNLGPEDVM